MERSDKHLAVFAVCVVAIALAISGVSLYQAKTGLNVRTIAYSDFLDDLDQGKVRTVTIAGAKVSGWLYDKSGFQTVAADDPDLIRQLRAKKVRIHAVETHQGSPGLIPILAGVGGLILFGVLGFFLWRRMPGASGGPNTGLGKSRARLLSETQYRVTFADVAGVEEAKEGLQEIVDFLREPQTFQRLGGRIPKGVLLVGPPGSGKTLLARAIAGEANAPFFTISGSDFVEMFVGVGASRVRDMFAQAKKHAPCIIFVDEIDAVGRKRGAGLGGGNDEREQTLNQLLVEMDGFQSNEGVILIAATNRPDVLDPALLRPGRFDREIVVANPDVLGREHILAVHVRNAPLEPDVDLKALARRTPGFSGADLMNLANEAALLAARRRKSAIGMAEFDDAKDTVTMGAERRTHVMTEDERRLTAYREGGRAVVALHAPAADPVHKATIITRGRSSGMVKQLPEEDQEFLTLRQMTSRLAIMMAGRAAEEMVFGAEGVTSGAARDIEEATKLARLMVTRWGLSKALGAVAYGENQDEVFLGAQVARHQNVSEETARAIDLEVRALVDGALGEATSILDRHRPQLETLAAGLLLYETLTGEEIRALLNGEAPRQPAADEAAPRAAVGQGVE